jgi:hypothetical protein
VSGGCADNAITPNQLSSVQGSHVMPLRIPIGRATKNGTTQSARMAAHA